MAIIKNKNPTPKCVTEEGFCGEEVERGQCEHYDESIVGFDVVASGLSFGLIGRKCEDCRTNSSCSSGSSNEFSSTVPGLMMSGVAWVCLNCAHLGCERHAELHSRQMNHPLAVLSVDPSLGWCYACDFTFPIELPKVENQDESLSSEVGRDYVVRGIVNLGNTCFFNSVMQNLFANTMLRKHFSSLTGDLGPLTLSLKKLFGETSNKIENNGKALDPENFFKCLCLLAPQFKGYQQQDSHELLHYLLDGLITEELKSRVSKESPANGSSDSKVYASSLEAIFGGRLISQVSCLECGYTSEVCEPFLDLSLPISENEISSEKVSDASQDIYQFLPEVSKRRRSEGRQVTNDFGVSLNTNSEGTASVAFLPLGSGSSICEPVRKQEEVASQEMHQCQPEEMPKKPRTEGMQDTTLSDFHQAKMHGVDVQSIVSNEELAATDCLPPESVESSPEPACEEEVTPPFYDAENSWESYESLVYSNTLSPRKADPRESLCHFSQKEEILGKENPLERANPYSTPKANSSVRASPGSTRKANPCSTSRAGPLVNALCGRFANAFSSSWEDDAPVFGAPENNSDTWTKSSTPKASCESGNLTELQNLKDDVAVDQILAEIACEPIQMEPFPLSSPLSELLENHKAVAGTDTMKDRKITYTFGTRRIPKKEKVENTLGNVSVDSCLVYFTKLELLSDEHAWCCGNCSNVHTERQKHADIGTDKTDALTNQTVPYVEMQQEKDEGRRLSNEEQKGRRNEAENLNVKRNASKRILIDKVPRILTIHLKRFQDTYGRLKKLNGHISFQEMLNLEPYMDPRSCGNEKYTFRLIGVVEHFGSMGSGHYVAYVRGVGTGNTEGEHSSESRWFYASDSHVRETSLAKVLQCEAYILFYERIESQNTRLLSSL